MRTRHNQSLVLLTAGAFALAGCASGGSAEHLHVTERFIRKLIAEGELRAVEVGARVVRIRRTDFADFLRPVRAVPGLGRR